jgi:hypothetical protein
VSTVYFRFAAQGSRPLQHSALLERLLAHASAPILVPDWRRDAFRVIAGEGIAMPSIARAVLADDAAAGGAWVCLATPVHLVAGMSSVTLPEEGILALSLADAVALSSDFNREFQGGGVAMVAREPQTRDPRTRDPQARDPQTREPQTRETQTRETLLLCVFDRVLDVATQAPEAALGRDLFEYQASGPDASRLRRLMSEIEMWLFDHAVNRERASRSMLPITGMWLWGGGPTTAPLPALHGWVSGRDIFFSAFGDLATFPSQGGAGVVVSAERPGDAGWPEVESRWLIPAVAALRAGRIDRIELSAADRRLTVRKSFFWRWWRRPRPWWEVYEIQ